MGVFTEFADFRRSERRVELIKDLNSKNLSINQLVTSIGLEASITQDTKLVAAHTAIKEGLEKTLDHFHKVAYYTSALMKPCTLADGITNREYLQGIKERLEVSIKQINKSFVKDQADGIIKEDAQELIKELKAFSEKFKRSGFYINNIKAASRVLE